MLSLSKSVDDPMHILALACNVKGYEARKGQVPRRSRMETA